MTILTFFVIGASFIIGCAVSALLVRRRLRQLAREASTAGAQAASGERLVNELRGQIEQKESSIAVLTQSEGELREKLAREEAERASVQRRVEEQRQEFDQIQERLKSDFENLANRIFEDKSEKFKVKNKENLDTLLRPLQTAIDTFQGRVEKFQNRNERDSVELREIIKQNVSLNKQLSEDATNLTNALKGQSKTMGNWGELVLETILERSGLIKGQEYVVQESRTTEDGKRFQPDVVVNLPGSKHLVIDAKVSLVAYERYCSGAEGSQARDKALKDHLLSVKNHITQLGSKNYQDLYHISTPDFVLMFIPLEPAWILALQHEPKLYNETYDRGVCLVSPTTLLFALRTIANIWMREKQNRNALAIAKEGGSLYDKFVNFYEQLLRLGDCLKRTQECYDDSISKLKTGKGNLIRRVDKLKQLGARASKALPDDVVDDSVEDAVELQATNQSEEA